MKRILTLSFVLIAGLANAQQTKPKAAAPAKATPPPPPPPAPVLKNAIDSVSYAAGISVANFYKEQGLGEVNTALVTKAINDVLRGNKTIMDNNAANACLQNFMMNKQKEKSKAAKEEGEKFLATNKKKPGVKTTDSGLQYEILTAGTGESPTAEDTVTCHYRGTFIDGKGFDNSYDRGQPASFPLNAVIKGWTEGLQYMKVGAKYKFYIPYQLGYGEYDAMSIPGGSTLVFEVELLEVKRKK